jgi:hypothetical protein
MNEYSSSQCLLSALLCQCLFYCLLVLTYIFKYIKNITFTQLRRLVRLVLIRSHVFYCSADYQELRISRSVSTEAMLFLSSFCSLNCGLRILVTDNSTLTARGVQQWGTRCCLAGRCGNWYKKKALFRHSQEGIVARI